MSDDVSRLTVVDNTYHQVDGSPEPLGLVHRYSRTIKDGGQAYTRSVKVGGTWQPIDSGWLKGPALVILENREGLEYQVNPTHEDRASDKQKVVTVGFILVGFTPSEEIAKGLILQPGEHVKFQVRDVAAIRLRCEHKEAKVMIHLVPL